MTIKELRKMLKTLPSDAKVVVEDDYGYLECRVCLRNAFMDTTPELNRAFMAKVYGGHGAEFQVVCFG